MPEAPNELDAASTQELGERLAAGDLQALETLIQNHRDLLLRILSIRIGTNLREVLGTSQLLAGTEQKVKERLDELDTTQPARVFEWVVKLAEGLLRERIGIVTSHSASVSRGESKVYAGPRNRRQVAEELLDRTMQGLPSWAQEAVLARDYLKGDWRFVQERLGLKSEEAAKRTYRKAQEALTTRLKRLVRERKREG